MSLLHLIWRSLRQHSLSTFITSFSVALAGALMMSVWVVKQQTQATFTTMTGGWDAVLGARGAKLQLVLNSVFHLEASPGNLPWSDYETIAKNPAVALAIPIAVGDNYRGFRLVGTLTNLFSSVEYAPGKKLRLRDDSRSFEDGFREAVVGSFVAQRLQLRVGDEFHPYHGLIFNEKAQHSETYVVVGILDASNTPADRVIWIPLAGLQNMSGHAAETASDVSAVLVKLRSPIAGQTLDLLYNKQGNRLTFAWPIGQVMAQLFDKIGWFDRVLGLVAWLVAFVAAGSILASIYNSMHSRRRDLAILRSLGARRSTVFAMIVGEAMIIASIGMAFAFVLYAGILVAIGRIIRAQTGVVLTPWTWDSVFIWAPVALILMSATAGVVPAWKAYRSPVAENLSPES